MANPHLACPLFAQLVLHIGGGEDNRHRQELSQSPPIRAPTQIAARPETASGDASQRSRSMPTSPPLASSPVASSRALPNPQPIAAFQPPVLPCISSAAAKPCVSVACRLCNGRTIIAHACFEHQQRGLALRICHFSLLLPRHQSAQQALEGGGVDIIAEYMEDLIRRWLGDSGVLFVKAHASAHGADGFPFDGLSAAQNSPTQAFLAAVALATLRSCGHSVMENPFVRQFCDFVTTHPARFPLAYAVLVKAGLCPQPTDDLRTLIAFHVGEQEGTKAGAAGARLLRAAVVYGDIPALRQALGALYDAYVQKPLSPVGGEEYYQALKRVVRDDGNHLARLPLAVRLDIYNAFFAMQRSRPDRQAERAFGLEVEDICRRAIREAIALPIVAQIDLVSELFNSHNALAKKFLMHMAADEAQVYINNIYTILDVYIASVCDIPKDFSFYLSILRTRLRKLAHRACRDEAVAAGMMFAELALLSKLHPRRWLSEALQPHADEVAAALRRAGYFIHAAAAALPSASAASRLDIPAEVIHAPVPRLCGALLLQQAGADEAKRLLRAAECAAGGSESDVRTMATARCMRQTTPSARATWMKNAWVLRPSPSLLLSVALETAGATGEHPEACAAALSAAQAAKLDGRALAEHPLAHRLLPAVVVHTDIALDDRLPDALKEGIAKARQARSALHAREATHAHETWVSHVTM